MIDKKTARQINISASRQWHQIGKPGELACGVVIEGDVKWFKAKVSERRSIIEGPVTGNPVRSPKPAAARMAELADRAFLADVEISKYAF